MYLWWWVWFASMQRQVALSQNPKQCVRSRSVCCNWWLKRSCGRWVWDRLQAATFSLTSLSRVFQQKYLLSNAVVLLLPGWHENVAVWPSPEPWSEQLQHSTNTQGQFPDQSPGLGEWRPPPPKQCTQVSWELSVSVVNRWGNASYLSLSGSGSSRLFAACQHSPSTETRQPEGPCPCPRHRRPLAMLPESRRPLLLSCHRLLHGWPTGLLRHTRWPRGRPPVLSVHCFPTVSISLLTSLQ